MPEAAESAQKKEAVHAEGAQQKKEPEQAEAAKTAAQKKETEQPAKEPVPAKSEQPPALDGDRQKLLQMSEIGLWIDHYDDIFSDFDPRPYSQRALSDDFLNEAKKASREKTTGVIELKFLVPEDKRNSAHESMVKKRLHEHFKKHFELLRNETKKARAKGIALVLLGMVLMLGAGYVYSLESKEFIANMLIVLLEPSGWFMTWFGLDHVFYTAAQKKPDLEFYDKMSKCAISFMSY